MNDDFLVNSFKDMRSKLLRMSRSILHDEEEASDILQEAFCNLWPHRDTVHSNKQAAALTYTTVHNLSIDHFRKNKKKTDLDKNYDFPDDPPFEQKQEQRFQEVMKLVNQHLSSLQRTILNQREIEGKSIKWIANELHMEETAVRMNLSRARHTIKNLYNQQNK